MKRNLNNFLLTATIMFFTPSIMFGSTPKMYLYSEIESIAVADNAMDLYQCIMSDTKWQPEVISMKNKNLLPRLEIYETKTGIKLRIEKENFENKNLGIFKPKQFVRIACDAVKKHVNFDAPISNKNTLAKLSPKWSLNENQNPIHSTAEKPKFIEKNWPWLVGGLLAVGAIVLISSKKDNSDATPQGTPARSPIIRGISVR